MISRLPITEIASQINNLSLKIKGRFGVMCLVGHQGHVIQIKDNIKSDKIACLIGTVESIAISIVKAYRHIIELEKNPTIITNKERFLILREVYLEWSDIKIDCVLQEISNCKRRLDIEEGLIEKEYNKLLRHYNLTDPDDILQLAFRILSKNSWVANLYYPRIYRYVFIDELLQFDFAESKFLSELIQNVQTCDTVF